MPRGPDAEQASDGEDDISEARRLLRSRVDPVDYAEAVLDVTSLIPAGRVLTYGDIAELLDCGGPRQVGRALARGTRVLPWWRVLRAGGHPARGLALRARPHYDREGTPLLIAASATNRGDYRVDLATARWWPSDADHAVLADIAASLGGVGG
jgi:alkylated DNA nucleotide flippase Atl1